MVNMIGLSFIEVIVSLFLLSLVLLGINAMQVVALRESNNHYYISVAFQQLQNMAERLTVSDELSVMEKQAIWNKQNMQILPKGHGLVINHGLNREITIYWGNHQVGASGCLRMIV